MTDSEQDPNVAPIQASIGRLSVHLEGEPPELAIVALIATLTGYAQLVPQARPFILQNMRAHMEAIERMGASSADEARAILEAWNALTRQLQDLRQPG